MSRNRMVGASLVVLTVLFVSAQAFSADKVVLRHVYKAGEKYLAVISQDTDINQQPPGGGNPVAIKQTMRMDMSMNVLSVADDGTADVKVTYDHVALKQDSPYGKTDYDSADPGKKDANDPVLVGFKALLGQSLTMTITRRGEVKKVQGINKIIDAVLEQVPAGEQREAARRQVGQMMNEEHFSEQMSGLGVTFPEEAIGVGDAWDREQKMDLGFVNLVVKTNYKIDRMVGDAVEMTVVGTVSSGGEPAAGTPLKVSIEPGSRQQGKVTLSRANPTLADTQVTQHIIMTVTVGPQSIKQTVDGTVSVTVKRAGN